MYTMVGRVAFLCTPWWVSLVYTMVGIPAVYPRWYPCCVPQGGVYARYLRMVYMPGYFRVVGIPPVYLRVVGIPPVYLRVLRDLGIPPWVLRDLGIPPWVLRDLCPLLRDLFPSLRDLCPLLPPLRECSQ